jgi:hypothetical protein
MNSPKPEVSKVETMPKGAPILVDAVKVNGLTFIITGKNLKTASLRNEWQEDIDDPSEVICALKAAPLQIDLLKFWQRIPETEPKFGYYKEWRQVAAIPITTFQHWWEKQIRFRARNKLTKGQRLGVIAKEVEFSDDFVKGVVEIYNQSPIRRGKPFRHYGKDFQTVKAELSVDLHEAVFVGAYYQDELIGFIKFVVADRYAFLTLILDKVAYRDKAPMNAMIAKVVEICASRRIPYLTYTLWRRGAHGKFQESVGFERIPIPEYYVPLTRRGQLALRLRLHEGIKGLIPENLMVCLLAVRAKWYALKLARGTAEHSAVQPATSEKPIIPSTG